MRKKFISVLAAALLLLAPLPHPAFAQAPDIHVSYTGNQVAVFRGVMSANIAGSNSQAWIFATQPNATTSFFITNTGGIGNTVTVNFEVFVTGSPTVADFSNNIPSWAPATTYDPQNSLNAAGEGSLIISGNSTTQLQAGIANASQIVIVLSGATSTTVPLSLNVVFTPNGVLPKTASANPNVQPQTTFNTDQTGVANSAVAATINGVTGRAAYLYSVAGFCSSGSASISVVNGAQQIWHTTAGTIQTTFISFDWPVPLAGSSGLTMTITLSACGGSGTGTLIVQASQQ